MENNELRNLAALATKMLAVMSEVSHVAKNGRNKDQNYAYATEADVVAEIRDAMQKYKLGVFFSATVASDYNCEITTKSGSRMRVIRVNLKVTWVDTETGYSRTEFFDGEGMDTGDKAVYKAITGAEKYALLKTFLIPTGDDPEKDEREEKSKSTMDYSKQVDDSMKHMGACKSVAELDAYWKQVTADNGLYGRANDQQKKELKQAHNLRHADFKWYAEQLGTQSEHIPESSPKLQEVINAIREKLTRPHWERRIDVIMGTTESDKGKAHKFYRFAPELYKSNPDDYAKLIAVIEEVKTNNNWK